MVDRKRLDGNGKAKTKKAKTKKVKDGLLHVEPNKKHEP